MARRKAGRANRAGGVGVSKIPGSAESTPGNTDGEKENSAATSAEERTLDYVEVMACPGGCVNGGGQMKPIAEVKKVETTTDNAIDEEGFKRNWEMEGVEMMVKPQIDESMRWSTKSWVAQVEQVYWSGLPTPPASPSREEPKLSISADETNRLRADRQARQVIVQVCKPNSGVYSEQMDEEAERRRDEFLRTRYRKVESDITSLSAVKW